MRRTRWIRRTTRQPSALRSQNWEAEAFGGMQTISSVLAILLHPLLSLFRNAFLYSHRIAIHPMPQQTNPDRSLKPPPGRSTALSHLLALNVGLRMFTFYNMWLKTPHTRKQKTKKIQEVDLNRVSLHLSSNYPPALVECESPISAIANPNLVADKRRRRLERDNDERFPSSSNGRHVNERRIIFKGQKPSHSLHALMFSNKN